MTSTKPDALRLPPFPALLAEQWGQAHRARQRRVLVAASTDTSLRALDVFDGKIDDFVQSALLYGELASDYCRDKAAQEPSGPRQAAAVFLSLALAVQLRGAGLIDAVQAAWPSYPVEVLQAMWFYPIPANLMEHDQSHVVRLFQAARSIPQLQPLALELAGRCDVKPLQEQVTALLQQPQWAVAAMLALSRMGQRFDLTSLAQLAREQGPGNPWRSAYLQIVAVTPGQADDDTLGALIDQDPANVDAAWAIMAVRRPRWAAHRVQNSPDLPRNLAAAVIAITGLPDALIDWLADYAEGKYPVDAALRDVLGWVAGEIPADVRNTDIDAAGKAGAMRAVLLRVLGKTGLRLHPQQAHTPWRAAAWLDVPADAALPRLRFGDLLRQRIPPLSAGAVLEASHLLRRFAYIERAETAHIAFGLQFDDVFRRQQTALMLAAVVDEH